MQIEEGKFYRMRNGGKTGAMKRNIAYKHPATLPWTDDSFSWPDNGVHCSLAECYLDLIEEWPTIKGAVWGAEVSGAMHDPAPTPQGPTRTRLVTEIVPGTYNKVCVEYAQADGALRVYTNLFMPANASELRAAAAVLGELADALESRS